MSFASLSIPRHLLVVFLALTGLSTFFNVAEAVCKSVTGPACPARDNVTPVTAGYDPSVVDWGAMVADIKAIGNHEPRWCSFVIRAWFHDSMSIMPVDRAPFNGGTDASFFTDAREFKSPEGSLHGFTQFARHVVVQLALTHGASLSDTLMMASSQCTHLALGGTVDIAAHCESVGLPLHVGKLDHTVDGAIHANAVVNKVESIPIPHNRMSHMAQFFIKDINSLVKSGEKWKLTAKDVMAIMGSHTILMTQACTTSGPQKAGVSMDDRTCGGSGGRQRMFSWDNKFFQDISAGRCIQNSDKENVREMTPAQANAFKMCGFNSMEGFELGEHLECDAMKTAKASVTPTELAILEDRGPFGRNWHHVVWEPKSPDGKAGNERAPCCGLQCETCETGVENKFFCSGNMKGTASMWPYTYMDCEFNWVYNLGGKGYCDGGIGPFPCGTCADSCNRQWAGTFGHPRAEMEAFIQQMADAIELFRVDGKAWEQSYAEAFCKMSDFGSTFAPGKKTVGSVLTGVSGGTCLAPEAALSLKQCASCDLAEFGTFGGGTPMATTTATPAAPSAPPPANTTDVAAATPIAASPTSEDEEPVATTLVEEEDADEIFALGGTGGSDSAIGRFMNRFRRPRN